MTISHTGANSRLRGSKRVVAFLLLPLALLLSACQVNSDVTVTAAGGIHFTIDIIGDTKSDVADVDCNSYGPLFENFPGEVKVNDYMSDPSTDVLCQIVGSTDNGMDGKLLIDNDSSYILNLPVSDFLANAQTSPQGAYHLAVHMPGDIISAGEGAQIKGSTVEYAGQISALNDDIRIEASKNEGTPLAVWVVGLLVVLLAGVLLASRYLRKKQPESGKDSSKSSGKNDSARTTGDRKSRGIFAKSDSSSSSGSSSSRDEGVSVATVDSTVALEPLPEKYTPKNTDGISESYSEKIGMVDPIPQGSAADVVKRDVVMPPIPPETAFTSPIPGMPPRIPMPDELLASFTQATTGESKAKPEDASDESKPEKETPKSEASAFFSTFLDDTDSEAFDGDTDL